MPGYVAKAFIAAQMVPAQRGRSTASGAGVDVGSGSGVEVGGGVEVGEGRAVGDGVGVEDGSGAGVGSGVVVGSGLGVGDGGSGVSVGAGSAFATCSVAGSVGEEAGGPAAWPSQAASVIKRGYGQRREDVSKAAPYRSLTRLRAIMHADVKSRVGGLRRQGPSISRMISRLRAERGGTGVPGSRKPTANICTG